MTRRAAFRPKVEYPESDGKPLGESDQHIVELTEYAVEVLKDFFAGQRRVYVAGNNFVYYREGDPSAVVSPDCYVVKGVAKRPRRTYRVFEERGRTPSFVLEITSKSTKREDLGPKRAKYRDELRVPEDFILDPWRDWVPAGLSGLRLERGEYQPIAPGSDGRLTSRELGLELGVLDDHVRFYLPGAREPIPIRTEALERARAGRSRERAETQRERARADKAEAELKRVTAALEKSRRRRSR